MTRKRLRLHLWLKSFRGSPPIFAPIDTGRSGGEPISTATKLQGALLKEPEMDAKNIPKEKSTKGAHSAKPTKTKGI